MEPRTAGMSYRRARLLLTGATVAGTLSALTVNVLMQRLLLDGATKDLGPLQLRLLYNSGVSFSFGSSLPTWLVLLFTGALTVGWAVVVWRQVPVMRWPARWGMTFAVAGAAANVIDRAAGGSVTDYFHTGWFATFNIADVFITVGVVVAIASLLFQQAPADQPDSTVDNATNPDGAAR